MIKSFIPHWEGLLPRILGLAGIFVIVAGLKLGKDLFGLLALGTFISFILSPVVNLLKRGHFPKVVAVMVVVTIALGVLGCVGYVIVGQVASISKSLPVYRQNILSKVSTFNVPFSRAVKAVQAAVKEVEDETAAGSPGKQSRGREDPVRVEVVEASAHPLSFITGAFVPSMGVLGDVAVVVLLVLFFLVYSSEIRDRIISLAGTSQGTVASQAIAGSMSGVVRYIALQAIVNASFGTALGVGLWMFGVPNALLWGFSGALFRFVPYLGPLAACMLPIALSVAVFPGFSRPLWVMAFVIALETLHAYIIEPLVYGKRTGLSPLAIIVAAVFWAWLWGGMGLLLSIPLTVCLLALGKHIPQLQFLEVLLGGDPAGDPKLQIYLRLLAHNQVEAAELIEKESEGKSLVGVYDSLLLPVLQMVDADRIAGKVDDQKALEVVEEIRHLAKDAGETAEESQNQLSDNPVSRPLSSPPDVTILCLPASSGTDELATSMLARILTLDGYRACSLPATTMASEKLEEVEREKADVVVISALPPSNILRARYLYKRLRARFPDLPIVVGIWGSTDTRVLEHRIAPDHKAIVLGSFAAARESLRENAKAAHLRKRADSEASLEVGPPPIATVAPGR